MLPFRILRDFLQSGQVFEQKDLKSLDLRKPKMLEILCWHTFFLYTASPNYLLTIPNHTRTYAKHLALEGSLHDFSFRSLFIPIPWTYSSWFDTPHGCPVRMDMYLIGEMTNTIVARGSFKNLHQVRLYSSILGWR